MKKLKGMVFLVAMLFLTACAVIRLEEPNGIDIDLPIIVPADPKSELDDNSTQKVNNETTPTTPNEPISEPVLDTNYYLDYYRIVESTVFQYGYCPTIGADNNNSGLVQSILRDFDSDGSEELLIAFWMPDQDLQVQVFGKVDEKTAVLLEREAPINSDNCAGFDVYIGTECFLAVSEDNRFGGYSNQPSVSSRLYKLDHGQIVEAVFREVYSRPFSSGDPIPDDITISYYIDGEEYEESDYSETWRSMIGERLRLGFCTSEDAAELKAVVSTLAERAGIPQEESSTLLDRISALALIYAIDQKLIFSQEEQEALVGPIRDFDIVKELALQLDLPQEDQAAIIEAIEELAHESAG